MTTMYTYDLRTYETTGSRPAQVVGGKELTISAAATSVPTGPDKTGHTQVYKPKGTARWIYDPQSLDVASQGEHGTWYYIADHRQYMDSKGTKQGGTPYWQPVNRVAYSPCWEIRRPARHQRQRRHNGYGNQSAEAQRIQHGRRGAV